jgi:hypothetical protein
VVDVRTGAGAPAVVTEFPPPGTPLFPMGKSVPLEFSGEPLTAPLSAEGRTVLWSSSSTAFTYVFEVSQATISVLLAMADRRAARRVLPEGARHDVRLSRPGGTRIPGVLQDLSLGGAGVQLTLEGEAALLGAYEIVLELELEDETSPLELFGFIRSRVLVGENVRHGIQFDAARIPPGALAALRRVALE